MHYSLQHLLSMPAEDTRGHMSGLSYWSIITAYGLAAAEGIRLTDGHFEVIHYLRDDYFKHGPRQHSGQLLDALEQCFVELGGMRHISRLFPNGSLSQAMKIAGLPLPEHQQPFAFQRH